MRRTAVRDVRAAVADAARRARTPIGLERDVARQLARVVPYDLWCGLTIDPATGHPTGGFHDEGLPLQHMPRLLELEFGAVPDFLALRALAGAASPVQTLGGATGGDPARSPRYRDVFEPAGVGHEVRVALRGAGGTWGALILFRGTDRPDFSPAEIALLTSISPAVAEGLRRAAVLGEAGSRADGPGLLLCTVASVGGTAELRIDHVTEAAGFWLASIDDGVTGELPYAIASLVHSARHQDPVHGPWRARMRTRTGDWITAHAERLGPTLVSVIIEPTRSHELAELRADAYLLTGREREVAALAVRGLTNPQIAQALFLSPYTVQDHLKQIFAKTGAAGRTELASRLFLDRAS